MNHVVMAKKATNISLPVDVYLATKEMGINISQVCEQALREIIRAREEREWNDQNAAFIKVYNETLETEGLALQEWRTF